MEVTSGMTGKELRRYRKLILIARRAEKAYRKAERENRFALLRMYKAERRWAQAESQKENFTPAETRE